MPLEEEEEKGEQQLQSLHSVANDQHSAESRILGARVALQLHRFGLNPLQNIKQEVQLVSLRRLFKNSFRSVSCCFAHPTHLQLCKCTSSFLAIVPVLSDASTHFLCSRRSLELPASD